MTDDVEFRLDLSFARPPLNENQRMHWKPKADHIAAIRHEVSIRGRAARIPQAEHMTVQLVYAPGHNIDMDAPNWYPTVKACVDGLARGKRKNLVGLDIVPDDTDKYVAVLTTRILRPPEPGPRCWLMVWVTPLEQEKAS